jgi:hypothetical protein
LPPSWDITKSRKPQLKNPVVTAFAMRADSAKPARFKFFCRRVVRRFDFLLAMSMPMMMGAYHFNEADPGRKPGAFEA